MKFWIAREIEGCLFAFTHKPRYNKENPMWEYKKGNTFYLDETLFPEVTFENSPQQVEIKLVK